MRNDKNYLASLISAIGTFVLFPAAIMAIWTIFRFIEYKLSSFQTVNLILSFLIIIVFIVETVYLIVSRKEDKFGKTYNIISIVLNALLSIVGILLFILMTIEMFRVAKNPSFIDSLEIIISLLDGSIITVVSGFSMGFKISELLKK